jgi:hypothetical protein
MAADLTRSYFDQPTDLDQKLWRYMSTQKFSDLLEKSSLFFSRADKQTDAYEGTTTQHFQENFRELSFYKNAEDFRAREAKFNEWVRQWVFINCWHLNETESEAMWRLYGNPNEAVAIQTTYRKLAQALPCKVSIGLVRYVDFETYQLKAGNGAHLYAIKRQAFAHEREVRAIFEDWNNPKIDPVDGELKIGMCVTNKEPGHLVKVDLSALFECVRVAPKSSDEFLEVIKGSIHKHGLDQPVLASALDRSAFF